MNELDKKIDRTNELLEKLISIQETGLTRQRIFLKLYKFVLITAIIWLCIYTAINIYLI